MALWCRFSTPFRPPYRSTWAQLKRFVFIAICICHSQHSCAALLLHGNLPVTITKLLPDFLALTGTCVPPKSILFFACIEFCQMVIGFIVIIVAFFDIVSHVRAD